MYRCRESHIHDYHHEDHDGSFEAKEHAHMCLFYFLFFEVLMRISLTGNILLNLIQVNISHLLHICATE